MAIRTIVALFDDYRDAEGAIRELESMSVPSTDINLIANNAGNRYGDYPQYGVDRPARTDHTDTASGAGTGAGIGAVLGGAAGLLAGIGALAIPGVGRWWPPVRLLRPLPAPGWARRSEDLSGHWSRRAFPASMRTFMPRRCAAAGPW